MTTRRWFRNVGSGRGNPRDRAQSPWRRTALAVVTLAVVAQAGCAGLRSDVSNVFTRAGNRISSIGSGCGTCGLLGGRRVFRSAPVVESCEPGMISAPMIEAMPGTVIQGPGAPLLPVPPAIPVDEMPRLEPAEPAPPGNGSGLDPQSRNGEGGAVKSVYETSAPRVGINPTQRRGESLKSSPGSDSIRQFAPRSPLPVDEVLSELPPITATMDGSPPLASSLPEEAGPVPAALVAAKTGGA
ncbi:MAG: hypothetical protein ABI353_06665, partial [Isosphaeraceae bacterium]